MFTSHEFHPPQHSIKTNLIVFVLIFPLLVLSVRQRTAGTCVSVAGRGKRPASDGKREACVGKLLGGRNQRARLGDALTHGESGLVFELYFAGPLEAQALTTVLFDWPTSPSRWRWRVCKTEHVLGLSEH
jgi:hypothetical protein